MSTDSTTGAVEGLRAYVAELDKASVADETLVSTFFAPAFLTAGDLRALSRASPPPVGDVEGRIAATLRSHKLIATDLPWIISGLKECEQFFADDYGYCRAEFCSLAVEVLQALSTAPPPPAPAEGAAAARAFRDAIKAITLHVEAGTPLGRREASRIARNILDALDASPSSPAEEER